MRKVFGALGQLSFSLELTLVSLRLFVFRSVVFFRNLEPRSHSVTGNVRSGKVRRYTIFHWPLKKGCGNAIYAPIGLFRGARDEGF